MVRGSSAVKGATRPDCLRDPHSLLYNRHQVSFQGVKRTGRGSNNPPSFSAKFANGLEPYPHLSSVPAQPWHGPNFILTHIVYLSNIMYIIWPRFVNIYCIAMYLCARARYRECTRNIRLQFQITEWFIVYEYLNGFCLPPHSNSTIRTIIWVTALLFLTSSAPSFLVIQQCHMKRANVTSVVDKSLQSVIQPTNPNI